jgi:opacity protein-like surface antigen
MNLLSKITLCFIFLLYLSNLKGQADFRQGFVITNESDTLHGLINFRGDTGNAQKCEFKKSGAAVVKEYKPFDIQGYRFTNSKYYISKTVVVNGARINLFLEFLIHGTADLYSFNDGKTSYFFIQKSGQKIYELIVKKDLVKRGESSYSHETNEYVNTLKRVLADCPRFFPTIDNTAYEAQSLMMLLKRYNDYVSSEKSVFYEKQPPDVKLKLAPFFSVNSSNVSFEHSAMYEALDFQRSTYATIGLLLNTSLPKSNRWFSFQTSIEVGKNLFYGDGVNPTNSLRFEEVYIQDINIIGKAGFKFTYPQGKFRPTLMIGGNMLYALKRDGIRVEDSQNGSTIAINEGSENVIAKALYGMNFNLGIDYHVSSKIIPFISIGYCTFSGTNKNMGQIRVVTDGPDISLNTFIKTFNINAGLYF